MTRFVWVTGEVKVLGEAGREVVEGVAKGQHVGQYVDGLMHDTLPPLQVPQEVRWCFHVAALVTQLCSYWYNFITVLLCRHSLFIPGIGFVSRDPRGPRVVSAG
jgi:hypothetical protein